MTLLAEHPKHIAPAPTRSSGAGRPLEVGLVMLAVTFVVALVRPLSDPDVWWHLRTGELIANQGFVDSDPWSFASTNTWLLHEWLSELAMYQFYAAAGNAGVVALISLNIAALLAVIATTCRQVSNPLIVAVILTTTLCAVLPSMGARPQLVSWVLLAAVCPYLRRCVEVRRLPWWFLPIIVLWANLHGLWVTAIALLGFLVIGLAVEEGWRGWRTTARFTAVLCGSLAAAAAGTPSGPVLLLAPLHVRDYARFVTEWAPPSIADPTVACALALVIIVVVDWARSQVRIPPTTISFVVGATALGLLYTRTVPVVALALAPLAAAALQARARHSFRAFGLDGRDVIAIVAVLLVALPVLFVEVSRSRAAAPGRDLPTTTAAIEAATDSLDELPGEPRVLNEYALGGWLLWAARDASPAIDGRTEVFSEEYVEDYLSALAMRPGWAEFVTGLDADAAVLLQETPLTGGLQHLGWTVVRSKDNLLVLTPPPHGPSSD